MPTPRPQSTLAKRLAQELVDITSGCPQPREFWVGLAGAPGSGKSTLARNLQSLLGTKLTVIPMDGYHFYRRQLDDFRNPAFAHARRGAPWTFDAQRFVNDLRQAKQTGHGSFPSFDHGIGDPVEDNIHWQRGDPTIILVEGNYLLLDDSPWCHLRNEILDLTWFLDVSIDLCMQRVYKRHIATGKHPDEAAARVENNDRQNAELVNHVSRQNANRTICVKS